MIGKLKRKAASKALGVSEDQMSRMESLQKEIAEEKYRHEEGGVVVKVTGDMKIDYVSLDGEARDDIKKAINKALNKAQKDVQKKMMSQMGALSKMFGG